MHDGTYAPLDVSLDDSVIHPYPTLHRQIVGPYLHRDSTSFQQLLVPARHSRIPRRCRLLRLPPQAGHHPYQSGGLSR